MNKSIQRIYNTFEKSQPPSSLSLYLFLFLFLPNFYSFSLEKKGILPGLIAACYELESNAPSSLRFLTLLLSIPSDYSPFLSSRSIRITLIWLESLAGIFDSVRTSSVPCKCRPKRNEASHLTPCD